MKPRVLIVALCAIIGGTAFVAMSWWRTEPGELKKDTSQSPAATQIAPSMQAAPTTKPSSPAAVASELVSGEKRKKKAERTAEEERVAQMAQSRKVIERWYGGLFAELQLSAEKRAALISLLVDLREAARDYAAAHAAGGLDATTDREKFDLSVEALRESIREKIKALLGEQDYLKYLDGEVEAKHVAAVERLQKDLRATSAPLSPEQGTQFLDLLRASKQPKIDAALIERAESFLSPAQVEALRAELQQMQLGPQKENIQRTVREATPVK